MSKTDKTTPAWVVHARDGRAVHDHIGRDCRPDSLEAARRRHAGLPSYRHAHSVACPAWDWVEEDCPGPVRCWTARTLARYRMVLGPDGVIEGLLPPVTAATCGQRHRALRPTGVACPTCVQADDDLDVCENRVDLGNYVRSLTLYGRTVPAAYMRGAVTRPRRQDERAAARRALRDWNSGYRPEDDEDAAGWPVGLEDSWEPAPERRGVKKWYW